MARSLYRSGMLRLEGLPGTKLEGLVRVGLVRGG